MNADKIFLLAAALTLGSAFPTLAMTPTERCAAAAPAGKVDMCHKALAQQPDDIGILRNLARAQIEAADFDGAVDTYERVTSLRPNDPQAHEDLAGTLGFIRQYERAAREMERVLDLRTPRPADYRVLAIMYSYLNNPGLAAQMTLRAADMGDPIAMFDLREYYRDGFGVRKDLATAVAWTERAAETGHLGAMALLVDIYLNGLYGQAVDEDRAVRWAEKLRAEERNY
ncbi:MAG: tetratricopeptide repeat protein [Rhodospirillales bacterium]